MDLTTLTMTGGRLAARQAFLEYKHAVDASFAKEIGVYDRNKLEVIARQREADEAIMAGYRQLALGRQVIDVRATVASGGLNAKGFPKIALARADMERVSVRLGREGEVIFDRPDRRGAARSSYRITLPEETFPRDRSRGTWDGIRANAMVPIIPPKFRPTIALDRFWLLFEASYQSAPVDPALLKPIGTGLAVVVATWDLSPLERAVLGMVR